MCGCACVHVGVCVCVFVYLWAWMLTYGCVNEHVSKYGGMVEHMLGVEWLGSGWSSS